MKAEQDAKEKAELDEKSKKNLEESLKAHKQRMATQEAHIKEIEEAKKLIVGSK